MFRKSRILTAGASLAVAAIATLMLAQSAEAAVTHGARRLHVRAARFIPAHLRPGYVGLAGYAGGPPGVTPFTPIEFPNNGLLGLKGSGLLGGGGLLGSGLPLQTGIFTGLPVLGTLGL